MAKDFHTVEPILQLSAIPQLGTFNLDRGEDAVENHGKQHVTGSGSRGLPIEQTGESILRPANLHLKLVEGQGLGAQERWRRATGDVVADEVEDVNEDGEAEGDSEGTGTVDVQLAMIVSPIDG